MREREGEKLLALTFRIRPINWSDRGCVWRWESGDLERQKSRSRGEEGKREKEGEGQRGEGAGGETDGK